MNDGKPVGGCFRVRFGRGLVVPARAVVADVPVTVMVGVPGARVVAFGRVAVMLTVPVVVVGAVDGVGELDMTAPVTGLADHE